MNKLLIATHNKAKLAELKSGIKPLVKKGVKILSLNDLKINEEPEEAGKTFEENARLKAKFYSEKSGLPTLADDGGLIIPSLNNEPGVKSRRWLGYDATDEELIKYTLKKLRGFTKENRVAYLKVCLCFYNGIFVCEEEKIIGHIAEIPSNKRNEGYPFRALFIVDKFNKFYDELTNEEHKSVNHRLKALKKLIRKIKQYLIE